jgi:hypothetical protein
LRVLLLFLDGVGIGPDDAAINPFLHARMPVLRALLGGIPVEGGLSEAAPGSRATPEAEDAGERSTRFRGFPLPLDATLDMPGTPQSGTGQAALLTGRSTAEIYGSHFGPWTPVRLRPLVEEESLLRRARDAGRTVAFANAYPKGWPGPRGGRRVAGPPLAARGAGVLDRHEEELGSGDAVSSEIVNDGWREHLGHDWLPEVTPWEAGVNLAGISARHDLTLYAHYTTDTAGHRGRMAGAVRALERVDHFLGGLIDHLPTDTLMVVASDHGNIEDVRGGHTRNPALGIVARAARWDEQGSNSPTRATPGDLREVAPFLLRELGVPD